MIKHRVFATTGKLRAWKDVWKLFRPRIIPPNTLKMLLEHVDPTVQSYEPTPVPAKVLTALKKAWKRLGVPGSDFVTVKGKPKPLRKPNGTLNIQEAQEEDEDVEEPVFARMERAKLKVQEENLAFRQLQTQRMSGLMLDRATVRARSRVMGIMMQRFLTALPAVVTGELVKVAALSDGQLRAVERTLQDLVPRLISELRREVTEMDKDAATIASSARYGDRNWSGNVDTGLSVDVAS